MIEEKLCILSVLGGRASLAEAHFSALAQSPLGRARTRKIFYVSHADNLRLHKTVLQAAERRFKDAIVIFRNPISTGNPGGMDYEYDEALAQVEGCEAVLCLHDDTLVTPHLSCAILDLLNAHDFVGYLDPNVSIESYQRILLDGIPLSQIRLGTWFLLARLPIKYQIGCGRYFPRHELEMLIGRDRIVVPDDPTWLNGNCLLNLLGRVDGKRFLILREDGELFARHVHAGTWALVKMRLLRYDLFDSDFEEDFLFSQFSIATTRVRLTLAEQFHSIAARFEAMGIKDTIVNLKMSK